MGHEINHEDGMNFSHALELLKTGGVVARAGWNGKGMWLTLVTGWNGTLGAPVGRLPHGWKGHAPFIAMYTADGFLVPWLASQTDLLAEDWGIVELPMRAAEPAL